MIAGRAGTRLGGRDRLLPVLVALIILIGSLSGVTQTAPVGAIGATSGDGAGPRVGIAALNDDGVDSGVLVDGGSLAAPGAGHLDTSGDALADGVDQPDGPYLLDGTLLKPIGVTTGLADGSLKIQTYRVRSGDTLTGIARHYGISMMTIWWANHLKSKDDLKVGEQLLIPPVNGIVRIVKQGDTLDTIAGAAKIPAEDIVALNGLTDTTLAVGQTLILPGAVGKPIAESKPATTSTSSGHVSAPTSYSGGAFAWPVPGGYISQYFHYGHPAIDIAAPYGSRIVAAAGGKVIFAGWKSNGGGYQVWIAHGSGLFTTYNHMSAIGVGTGQYVSRGQFVGRVGTSGWATGPHCHFEVWRGEVWGGGYRVNPLNYF